MSLNPNQPLVTVIITCYNQGRYLTTSIESVYSQSLKESEIILIDDGSTDNTRIVAEMYPDVRYVYQENQGLSAARNTGIDHAKGKYLVFLDADDWLLPQALAINLSLMRGDQRAAFVSGAYQLYYEDRDQYQNVNNEYGPDAYLSLLRGNFIGMHATVMYARWVFDSFRYDTSLSNCEDYDIYLNIARKFPVLRHQQVIAVYRYHLGNMSKDYPRMLRGALHVMKKHEKDLRTEEERESYLAGIESWKHFYSKEILLRLQSVRKHLSAEAIDRDRETLKENSPELFAKLTRDERSIEKRARKGIRMLVKRLLPVVIVEKLKRKPTRLTDLGVVPLSTDFGYDRGGPVDRYYIEDFLQRHSGLIRGRVLEIGDNDYTLRFGGGKVDISDILHVDASNQDATFVGDLTDAPQVPGNAFDCIVLTQTLHLIYDYKKAVETCYRVLKPGGVLLVTVPGISHIGQDQWGKYWQWSFTNNSLNRLLTDIFGEKQVKLETFGNVLVASAFLYGAGLPELTKEQMNYHDKHFQVIIAATAFKK
ncbi:glycosyltransferase [Flavihumibacter petaseus]|uniref:Putative glycosyltransferase n=1 Tax=Flavihumibacter petaseus NBRC 106054 TaxID=1220578 RepID=A0A0E9N5E7_9BACT|nr:glycosyltransferase [Flavihumibacter petaseus]GAO45197.1 putative glycosyltransferase [Flavihumibacter petaseus NBRC 106054]